MAEDLGDKTEMPTARRREEARDKGQVARSTDLAAAIDLFGATIMLVAAGGMGISAMGRLLRAALAGRTPGDPARGESVIPTLAWAGWEVMWIVVPAMAMVFAVSLAGQIIQVGWHPTAQPLKPDVTRMSPIKGLRRIFERRNLVKSLMGVVKLGVAGAVAWLVILRNVEVVLGLPLLGVKAGALRTGLLLLELVAWLLALLLAIGVLDFLYQRWQHTQDLKMTRREVKDERKQMDGDPDVKSRRLRMAQQISMQRVQSAVPGADVVVTNPTHFAVALRYDAERMRAPKVIAKGADVLAFRIREVAARHGVAIVERPPLARGLFYAVREGEEVPAEYYEAVAEVLAYVYRMEGRAA